jgi:peptidoglycan/xylan/chitin deacetylase (PgdA/CDA1 family)
LHYRLPALKRRNFGLIYDMVIVIIIPVIILTGFLLPTLAYGQLPYLANAQTSENQGNKDRDIIIAGNESNSPLSSNAGYASGNNTTNKVVIINFDDSHKSDYAYAKPILDRYGFKATFFEVCGWITSKRGWGEVSLLQHDGMDIESHTMTHSSLDTLSQSQLDYEIGQSKQCFLDHGVNTTIFAYPYGHGSNNATVVNTVAKNYSLARTNVDDVSSATPLARLVCDACSTSADDGTVTPGGRYSINSWVHKHIEGDYSYETATCVSNTCPSYNNSQVLQKFIAYVNSQNNYNKDGIIRAIPIVVYHGMIIDLDVSYSKNPNDTTMNLFNAEMKYLHDNGFRVLTISDLGYDKNSGHLYIKNKTP